MLKKLFSAIAVLLFAGAVSAGSITAKASKNASIQEVKPGVWQLTVTPCKGWAQAQFAQKDQ